MGGVLGMYAMGNQTKVSFNANKIHFTYTETLYIFISFSSSFVLSVVPKSFSAPYNDRMFNLGIPKELG